MLRKAGPLLVLASAAAVSGIAGIAGAGMVPGVSPPALQPAGSGGVAAVERALAKLSTHKRLLVIGAHPDDEDTALLTLVARGMGGEAAYLSLSRGEGGQNLIGPELGVGLGLIRSRELLAAREVDGGRQFFTRAYDFGFTRSLDETLRLWPKEVLLEDAVRVIRRFKPQVVVSIFPASPQAGHGQHQAAGAVAPEAFRLAGDPAALPGLAAEGLVPWTPEALYRAAWFDRASATMTLPLGRIDPLSGKSFYQLAMASRSMHRSQDMGRLQELGPQDDRVTWVSGGAGAAGKELFAGIDSHLAGIARTLPDEGRRRDAAAHLEAAEKAVLEAREKLSPDRPEEAAHPLAEALRQLRAARDLLAPETAPTDISVAALIDEKIDVAETGLAAALGIAVDASTDRETLTAGEAFPVQAALWNDGGESIGGASVTLMPAPEWGDGALPPGERRDLAAGALSKWELQASVPAAAPPTVPYFLRRPLAGSLYDWSPATPAERGEPFGPPPLTARFTFRWNETEVTLDREVVHRHQDQAVGEVRRPLRVVPRVEVAVAEHLLAWPVASREPRRLPVTLTSRSRTPLSGRLELTVPGGASPWPAVQPIPFSLEPGGEQSFEVIVKPPAGLAPGRYPLRLAAVFSDGGRSELAVPVIDYPHIRPTPWPEPAEIEVSAAEIRLPALKRVGYVRGASDRVPEYLRQVGVPVVLLGSVELLKGDLSGYDAIVVGSRAYETDAALRSANRRLLDYARKGGLVIVQYQQYPFIKGGYAPFPLDIAQPHDRVTDETAAVHVLDPASPVFTTPNRIVEADWSGWVQERGLYFAHTWDAAYQPLLAMADPGGPELRGSLLVARLGEGRYVYTGLALFRQLPAGVPGAYRLFANLLGLGKAAQKIERR